MNQRQQVFCDEYLVDLNATQAAIRAGYSPRSAAAAGCKNLQRKDVQEFIDEKMAQRSQRTGVNSERVVQELARIAFLNVSDAVDIKTGKVKLDASKEDLAAITSLKVKQMAGQDWDGEEREVKFADKLKALELLGRHCGLWKDKTEVSGAVQVVVQYEYKSAGTRADSQDSGL